MKININDFTFPAQTCAEGQRVQEPQDRAGSSLARFSSFTPVILAVGNWPNVFAT